MRRRSLTRNEKDKLDFCVLTTIVLFGMLLASFVVFNTVPANNDIVLNFDENCGL